MEFLIKIYRFLFGYFFISCEKGEKTRLLNFFLTEKISAYPEEENAFTLALTDRKKVTKALEEKRIAVQIGEEKGVPPLLFKHRHRMGLFFGLFAAVLVVLFSSRVVWRIEITGNERIPTQEIVSDLESIGFGEGSVMRQTDYAELSAALRLKHDEIAHADIYTVGTVAHVHIREVLLPEEEIEKNEPAHLVASRDAVVESFDVEHGSVTVKSGSVVKKGELLVSGIVKGAHGDVLLHAEGKVYGRVTDEIVVEIPYKQTDLSVNGYQKGSFTLFFFGKEINIQKNAGNLPITYGTIVERERWSLPGGKTLPISWVREKKVFLKNEEKTLSPAEALRLAHADMKGKLTATLEGGRLITKSIATEMREDRCILKCTVSYVTCIAETRTIDVIP